MKVNKLLHAIEREEPVESLASLTLQERDYVYLELKSVMDVYEGQSCDI